MSHGAENMEYLNNPWLHNELHVCCVIKIKHWISHDSGITGFNHFVPLSKKHVVMSSWETDVENPSELSYWMQFQGNLPHPSLNSSLGHKFCWQVQHDWTCDTLDVWQPNVTINYTKKKQFMAQSPIVQVLHVFSSRWHYWLFYHFWGVTPRRFKCSQFRKDTLDFNFECIKLLQNDFCKQRYIP